MNSQGSGFTPVQGSSDTNPAGLWTPTEHRELRRPNTTQLSYAAVMSGNDSSGLDEIAKSSTLSADAQEFYPRGYQTGEFDAVQSQHHIEPYQAPTMYQSYPNMGPSWGPAYQGQYIDITTQQQQLMMAVAEQQEMARNNYITTPSYINNGTTTPWQSKQGSGNATDQLRAAMHELTLNPGEFDNLVMPLGDTFCQWLSEPEVIESVISQILEQSISEPNFRYNGARLLNLLNNLDTSADGAAFRGILLEKCRVENEGVEDLMSNNPRRVHSFTLFLAELFIQLELKKGSGSKISVLGEGLYDDLSLLLSQPNDDNVKCACQVLKLAGMHLEHEVSSDKMNGLESQLEGALASSSIGPNMRTLTQNVLNLRRHAWGRSPPSPAHQPQQTTQWSTGQDQPLPNHFLNEPVLYGPDGQMLTAEESRFLHAEDIGSGSEGEYDDGMDEELQVAYEEFLQLPPHST